MHRNNWIKLLNINELINVLIVGSHLRKQQKLMVYRRAKVLPLLKLIMLVHKHQRRVNSILVEVKSFCQAKWNLTWKCVWSRGMSLNSSRQKKKKNHPHCNLTALAECLQRPISRCVHMLVGGGEREWQFMIQVVLNSWQSKKWRTPHCWWECKLWWLWAKIMKTCSMPASIVISVKMGSIYFQSILPS